MHDLYRSLTGLSAPALRLGLRLRMGRGKEDEARIGERMGQPGMARPRGKLVWFHAASVGESQSTLVLIDAILRMDPDVSVLVTTGTVTSAAIMEQRLPPRALHQFYPLDHPEWVENFLNHWQPDMAIWMESELWPNMLHSLRRRHVHCVLVNGRLSPRSFQRWMRARNFINRILLGFDLILAQTEQDADHFRKLGAINVRVRDNIKYSALPLPCDDGDLNTLKKAISLRPRWLYASTHDGEEELACDLHRALMRDFPDLLTIIVPRHPNRRDDIAAQCAGNGLNIAFRGTGKTPPQADTHIYIADTLGELGLFYRLSPMAVIGRTFSHDGGGGHNPIEAAQLGCAVLHGPMTQNLSSIFDEMDSAGAAIQTDTPQALEAALRRLLSSTVELDRAQESATAYAGGRNALLQAVLDDIKPGLVDAGILRDDAA